MGKLENLRMKNRVQENSSVEFMIAEKLLLNTNSATTFYFLVYCLILSCDFPHNKLNALTQHQEIK
jgi:hypothetical protein